MSDGPKVTILNIDGEDSHRHPISQILQDAGFEVKEAASGADALRLVKENPDLVLRHVNLLDMNGFEVCKRIKMNPRTY